MTIKVYKLASEWVVSFPYSMDYVNRIKSVGNGRYNPIQKTWHFAVREDILIKIYQAFLPEVIEITNEEIKLPNVSFS